MSQSYVLLGGAQAERDKTFLPVSFPWLLPCEGLLYLTFGLFTVLNFIRVPVQMHVTSCSSSYHLYVSGV